MANSKPPTRTPATAPCANRGEDPMPPGEVPAKPTEPPDFAELGALNQRAKRGDVSALPRILNLEPTPCLTNMKSVL